MIRRLYIDNYKCLVNFDLRLEELSLLLGSNGAGKSSVLDVIYALRQILSGRAKIADRDAFGVHTLTRWQRRAIQTFELEVDLPDSGVVLYRLEVEHGSEKHNARAPRVILERLSAPTGPLFEFTMGDVQLYKDDHRPGPTFPGDWSESWLARFVARSDNPRPGKFLDLVRKFVVCGMYPHGMVAESRGEDPVLARDGSNFAAWYRGLVQERPDLLPPFMSSVAEVIPGATGLRLEKVAQEARVLVVTFEDGSPSYKLNFDEISDGQRALIVLYALLHVTKGQGHTLFLDEPDNYVGLPEIQPWLMALSDACGIAIPQAIVCSHHPELLDYLGERGILLERKGLGHVVTRRVADGPVDSSMKLSEVVARGWDL